MSALLFDWQPVIKKEGLNEMILQHVFSDAKKNFACKKAAFPYIIRLVWKWGFFKWQNETNVWAYNSLSLH